MRHLLWLLTPMAFVVVTDVALASEDAARRPPVEIAGSVSTLTLAGPLAVGIRVTRPTSTRRAFEIGVEWLNFAYREKLPDQWVAFYFAGGKQLIGPNRDSGRNRVFVTYGAAGWVDRAIDVDGYYNTLVPPVFPMVGIGHETTLGRRVALRADAQLVVFWGDDFIPGMARLSVGVSVPFRPYTR